MKRMISHTKVVLFLKHLSIRTIPNFEDPANNADQDPKTLQEA